MASNENYTAKFRIDISDLKKGIEEANRQIKLATAEFKNATAGMDDWSKSADGLSAKIKQQESIIESEKKKLDLLKEQLARVNAAQEDGQKIIDDLTKKHEEAVRTYGEGSEEAKKYAKQLDEAQKAQERNAKAAEDLALKILNQDTNVKNAEAQLGKFEDALQELQKQEEQTADATEDMADTVQEVDDTAGDTKGIDAFAVALGNLATNVITSVIGKLKDLVVQSIEVGKSFDTSMSKVAAVSGATGDELQTLRDKAKEMGSSTVFSASEAADAMNYMAMAGWKTEDMIDGLEGVLNLAAASGEDLATTSDIVTDALTAFGLSADDSGHFADVLAAASSNANTNVSMMGETFKYVAPVCGTLGYSVEDASVAIGLMANAGIKASQSGTALRKGLLSLTAPSETAAQEMQNLGFYTEEVIDTFDQVKIDKQMIVVQQAAINATKAQNSYNEVVKEYGEESDKAQTAAVQLNIANEKARLANEKLEALQKGVTTTVYGYNQALQNEDGSMKTLSETMEFLRDKLGGLSEAEQASAASAIFGTNAVSGMLAIVNASEKDYEKLTGAITEADGAAASMAKTMSDNLGGDVTLMKSNLESLQLTIYEKFEPALRKGVDTINELIDSAKTAVDWISNNLNVVITVATGLMTAFTAQLIANKVAAISAAAAEKGLTVAQYAVTSAQAALNAVMSANPIGIVIIAITALVAAFTVLWNKSEKFRNFWIGLWEKIKAAAQPVIQWLSEFFKAAWEDIKKVWDHASQYFALIWDSIKTIFSVVKAVLSGDFDEAWKGIRKIWDNVTKYYKQLWEDIKKIFSVVPKFFSEIFEKARSGIQAIWSVVSSWFDNTVIKPVRDYFTGMWEGLKKGASDAWEGIKNTFAHIADWFHDVFSNAWQRVKDVFSTGGKVFEGIKDGIAETFKNTVNAIIRGINNVISIPFNAINNTLDKLRNLELFGNKPFENLISTIDVPQIPELAKGGILKRGQIGLLEGNGAEAVVPLEKNTGGLKKIAAMLAQSLPDIQPGNLASGLNGGNSVSYNFVQNNNSPKALSRYDIYRQTKNLISMTKGV